MELRHQELLKIEDGIRDINDISFDIARLLAIHV